MQGLLLFMHSVPCVRITADLSQRTPATAGGQPVTTAVRRTAMR